MMDIVVERTDKAFVRVYGRKPVEMVQGLITNDLQNAPVNRAVYAGMLTPKGKLIADLRAIRLNEDVLLECHVDALEAMTANLKKFVPPLFARFEVMTSIQESSLHGSRATEVMRTAFPDAELPGREDELTRIGALWCIGSNYTGDLGYDLVGELPERSAAMHKLVAAGAVFGQLDELERRRIAAGVPRWGAELDDSVIPLEAGLGERMISQNKGCYTGQEVIIRILHRGHVNRHLRRVRLAAGPAEKGTALFDPGSGKQVGRLTSSAEVAGETLGLAYVRRELLLPATVALASVDGPRVEVQE